jgi:hypothetical protein
MQLTVAVPWASIGMMVVATAGRSAVPDVTVQLPMIAVAGGSGHVVVVLVAVGFVVGAPSVDGRSVPLVDEPRRSGLACPAAVGAAREHEALSSPLSDTIATMASRGWPTDHRRCGLAMTADLGARQPSWGRRVRTI